MILLDRKIFFRVFVLVSVLFVVQSYENNSDLMVNKKNC